MIFSLLFSVALTGKRIELTKINIPFLSFSRIFSATNDVRKTLQLWQPKQQSARHV